MKTKTGILAGTLFLSLFFFNFKSNAHCEIPCGIYGDTLRIEMIAEHITTIEKSMKMIETLSNDKTINYNQLIRWVKNKEEHAQKIQDIVSQYFLHQRIKIATPQNEKAYKKYTKQLILLHQMLISSMKTKQTTDLAEIVIMKETLESFSELYFQHDH